MTAGVLSIAQIYNWGSVNYVFAFFHLIQRHLQPLKQQHLPWTHDSIQHNTIFPMINPVLIVIVVARAHLINPLFESTKNPRHPSLSSALIVSGVRQKRVFLALERETDLESVSAGCMRRPTAAEAWRGLNHLANRGTKYSLYSSYESAHLHSSASLMNACIRIHAAFHNARALLF